MKQNEILIFSFKLMLHMIFTAKGEYNFYLMIKLKRIDSGSAQYTRQVQIKASHLTHIHLHADESNLQYGMLKRSKADFKPDSPTPSPPMHGTHCLNWLNYKNKINVIFSLLYHTNRALLS